MANNNSATISVLINNGDGTFSASVGYSTGSSSVSVTSGDFNKDGYPDLAVANTSYADTVSVFINNGDGTFAMQIDYATGSRPWSVVTDDFNQDGYLDLAVANYYTNNSDTVSVLINNGDGTFATKIDYFTSLSPRSSVTTGDFNQDGYPDLAVVNFFNDTISVLINNADGTFAAKIDYSMSWPVSVTSGDFNQDSYPDLAVANHYNDSVSILINIPLPDTTVSIDQIWTKDGTGTWNVVFNPGDTITVNEVITIQGAPNDVYNLIVRYFFRDAAGIQTLLGRQVYRNYSPGIYYVSLTATVPVDAVPGRGVVRNKAVLRQGGIVLDRARLRGFVNIK